MKSVFSKGLLAAVIGAMLCSTMSIACDKKSGTGEKGAAKKDSQTEKPKQESDAKTTTPKTDDKTAAAK
jgi:hypothetical protein